MRCIDRHKGGWLILLTVLILAVSIQAQAALGDLKQTTSAAPEKQVQEETVQECPKGMLRMDFVDTDIRDIIKTISKMTDGNFLIDKNVQGKITLISPSCVTKSEAYNIFLAVLQVNSFTVVKQGKLSKVVQMTDVIREPIPTRDAGEWVSSVSDNFITQLIPLTNISAEMVQSMFGEFMSAEGRMIAYSPSNTLIVVDSEASISRLLKIINKLDVEGIEETIEVIQMRHASAAVIAEQIMMLFPEMAESYSSSPTTSRRTPTSSSSKRTSAKARLSSTNTQTPTDTPDQEQVTSIIPDLRTNSLIVRANKLGLRRIRELVAKLDVAIPGGEGKIHVYYLQNANAEDIAATLQGLAGGTGAAPQGRSNRQSQSGSAAQRLAQGLGGGGLAGAAGALAGLAGGGDMGGLGGLGGGSTVAEFEGGVRITSDTSTNSLVIIASARDYAVLKAVIEKLDIKRRQVFVEALIMEVTLDKGRQLGFEFRSANNPTEDGGTQVIGGSNFGGISNAAQNPLGIAGLAVGAADGTISFGGQEFPNIFALFTALQTDSDINILSTPTLLTTDNEEAEIVVADNIPFVTGQLFSQSNNNPVTTIERQDVGITLRLLPQINESNRVTLQIEQEVSNVTDSPEGLSASNVGVTTSKRSAKTVVVVNDRQTVIIAGLMKDDIKVIESKVPLLGDIPLLGYLFKSSKTSTIKTNLVIFLTPYIVRDAEDFETITRMRNDSFKRFQEENQIIKRKNSERYPNEEMIKANPETDLGPLDSTIVPPPIPEPENPYGIDDPDELVDDEPEEPLDDEPEEVIELEPLDDDEEVDENLPVIEEEQ